MCARYKLELKWQEYTTAAYFDWKDPPLPTNDRLSGCDEVRPTDAMPILRRDDDGGLVADLRHWGYILMVDGKTLGPDGRPKKIRKSVINAMSEKLATSFMWKGSFKARRCLVPMSSWDEWPTIAGVRQRMRVSMPGAPVFMAAGLYDLNVDPKTHEKVAVFTICTVPPNEFLGTVHDRAPMVLLPAQHGDWLDGGEAALRLVGVHPDADAFDVKPA